MIDIGNATVLLSLVVTWLRLPEEQEEVVACRPQKYSVFLGGGLGGTLFFPKKRVPPDYL
jgi:hypothetical protein